MASRQAASCPSSLHHTPSCRRHQVEQKNNETATAMVTYPQEKKEERSGEASMNQNLVGAFFFVFTLGLL